MKTLAKGIATVLFYAISAALLIYAASRSLDFILATLPADQQIIGYLGLAATSGGMLAWLMVFLFKAEGTGQKVTAGLMTFVDMLGEFGLFSMDMLYQTGNKGLTAALTGEEIRMTVLALAGLIAVNILATVCFHLLDNENMRNMRETAVRDQLQNEALKHIEKHGEQLAHDLAPALANQWAREFESRFSDLRALGLGEVNQQPRAAQDGGFHLLSKPPARIPRTGEASPDFVSPGSNGNGHKGKDEAGSGPVPFRD